MDAGIARASAEFDAQPERRPRRRLYAEVRQRRQHLLALGFQGVDPQVERRAARHRGRLGHSVIAKYLRQIWLEPRGVIAPDMRRSLLKRARGERLAFDLRQWLRRKTAAVAQGGDGIGVHPALQLEHPEEARPRRVVLHKPGARGTPAEHIPDQTGNCGAIARAGKSMRGAPLLQRLRRRNALGVDGIDQFNGRG